MSRQRQITHDSHIVPKFYLKQWSFDGDFIYCYRTIRKHPKQKPWKSMRLKSVPVVPNLYTLKTGNGYDDSIERYLQEREAAASKVIRKLVSDSPLNSDDISCLVDFAITQMARSPLHLARMNEVISSSFNSVTNEAVEHLAKAALSGNLETSAHLAKRPESPFPDIPLDIALDEETSGLITRLPTGQRSALYAMGRTEKGITRDIMQSYNWIILECATGMLLPTSDNPFTRVQFSYRNGYRLDCGVGEPGTYLFMPITPTHLLAAKPFGERVDSDLLMSPYKREQIISAIVNNAHLYVFATKHDPFIEKARQSRVDPDYLNEYEKAISKWPGT